jgi:hypothetical protein
MMTDSERQWNRGWDGHSDAQALRLARLPLPEKIRWLEDAQQTVMALEQSRRRPDAAQDHQPDAT